VLTLDKYPSPKKEDFFSTLCGGTAYQQLSLSAESKQYLTVNTHKGLFCYTRLPYGISLAPGIFQHLMENVLKDIPKVVIYLDDILISGAGITERLQLLGQVLDCLDKVGLRLKKKNKCEFLVFSVTWAIR